MKRYAKYFATGFLVLTIALLFCGTGFSEDKMAISGKITPENQLVTEDGQIYDIADTKSGFKLLQNIDKLVEVKGTVSEKNGKKELTVKSFKVVE